jgi:hypothetical protein
MKINCQGRKQDHTLLLLAGLDSVSLRVMSGGRSIEVIQCCCRQVVLNSKS